MSWVTVTTATKVKKTITGVIHHQCHQAATVKAASPR
jgi:hypothetical protein